MRLPRDRVTEAELRYARAIDRYGGRCDGHLVIVQAQEWRDPAPDAGWSRFARTWEGHVVPGGHVTLITRHLAELTRTVGDAVARAVAFPLRPDAARMTGNAAKVAPAANAQAPQREGRGG